MVRLDGGVCDPRLLSMQQDTARAQKQHRIRSRITISRCQSARVDVRQSEERQQRDAARRWRRTGGVGCRGEATAQVRGQLPGTGTPAGTQHSWGRRRTDPSWVGFKCWEWRQNVSSERAIYLSLKALTIQMKHNKRLQVLSDKTCT